MDILNDGQLNMDVLSGAAKFNIDWILRKVLGNARPTARKKEDLIDGLDEPLSLDVAQLKDILWSIRDESSTGHFHVSLNRTIEQSDNLYLNLKNQHDAIQLETQDLLNISTDMILDSRYHDDRLSVAFVAKGEAEDRHMGMDREETIGGKHIKYKAYELIDVPLFSNAVLSKSEVEIWMRPMHKNTRVQSSVMSALEVIEKRMNVSIVPVQGLENGVSFLMEKGLIVFDEIASREEDGSKAYLRKSSGTLSRKSIDMNDNISTWTPEKGVFKFVSGTGGTGKPLKFKLDCSKGLFTFSSRVSSREAEDVIKSITGCI